MIVAKLISYLIVQYYTGQRYKYSDRQLELQSSFNSSPVHIIMLMLLTLIASAAAVPDPVRLFETINDPSLQGMGRSSVVEIKDVLMDQGVLLAESTFDSTLSKTKCMSYELCRFGANKEMQFGPAVAAFKVICQVLYFSNSKVLFELHFASKVAFAKYQVSQKCPYLINGHILLTLCRVK